MLRQIRELSVRLAAARDESEIFEACLDSLLTLLGVTRASILMFDQQGVMQFVASRGLSPEYRTAVTGHSPWQPDTRNASPIVIGDAADDESLGSEVRSIILGEGIRGLGFFPLIYGDRVIGKFMVYSDEPREFTEYDIAAGEVVAAEVAFGIARLRAEMSASALHERLEVLLASVPVVLWETEGQPGEERMVYVSEYIENLLGYPLSEWYERPGFWNTVVVAEADLETERRERFDQGTPGVNQLAMRHADGSLVWAEVRTSVVRDKHGRPAGFRGVTFDVTDTRRKEQERLDLLRTTQESQAKAEEADRRSSFLARFSEAMAKSLEPDVILSSAAEILASEIAAACVIDTDASLGGRRWHSRRTERNDGGSSVAVEQRRLEPGELDNALPGRLPAPIQELRDAGVHGSAVQLPVVGSERRLALLSLFLREQEQESRDSFLRNIASRLGTALLNAQLYRELVAANRAKDDFLATLSHELRTPLTSIIGWASMLEGGLGDDDRELAIRTIRTNATLQRALIDEILDLSRLTRGKLALDLAVVGLESIVRSCADTLQPMAVAKQIRLHTDVPAERVPVNADAERLHQVVTNLIGNAVKFTPEGGSIEVRLTATDDQAELTVTDSGIGIQPDFLPRVFEPFLQGDSSSTRVHSGLGLGLSLVRNLVRMHRGEVTAESEGPGRGATFRVHLPLAQAGAEPSPRATAESAPAPTPGAFRAADS